MCSVSRRFVSGLFVEGDVRVRTFFCTKCDDSFDEGEMMLDTDGGAAENVADCLVIYKCPTCKQTIMVET